MNRSVLIVPAFNIPAFIGPAFFVMFRPKPFISLALFLAASAVVVNVGALGSHAMIVSRELGIPCVVSVVDATDRIPDGAMITVDGTAGTVTLE